MDTQRIRELVSFPLYQPIEHLDFAGFLPVQPCAERLQQIMLSSPAYMVTAMPWTRTMVDFGCHTGWFCRAFSKMGWKTVGIDKSADHLEVASLLNEMLDAMRHRPIYLLREVFEFSAKSLSDFQIDIALCLSVAMYLFDEPSKGWAFFNQVSRASKCMYMDFGGMYADRLPFNEETVGELMLQHTLFQSWRKIGSSEMGRALFMFTK